MDINNLIKEFTMKKDENIDLYLLGREVKQKRIEQNLTLKNVSEQNLSISYLSKIENNKILPNLKVASDLIEKFNIDRKIFESLDIYMVYLEKIMELIYFNKMDSIVKIYTKANEKFKFNLNLLNYLYFIIKDKLVEIDTLYKIIFLNRETLKKIEVEIFIVFTFVYKIKIFDFNDAFKLLNLIENIEIKNAYIKEIYKIYSLELFKNEIYKIYYLNTIAELENVALEKNNLDLIEDLKVKRIFFLLENKIIAKAKSEYQCISKVLFSLNKQKRKKFILNYNYLSNKNLKNIKLLSQNNLFLLEPFEIIFLLKAHESFNNVENIKEILESIKKVKKEFEFLDIIYINYLKIRVEESNEKLKKYLTEICFESFLKSGDISNVLFYKEKLEKILILDTKYKNYYLLQMRYNKALKEISGFYGQDNKL